MKGPKEMLIGVTGIFNAGKSSFLNALMGRDILPCGPLSSRSVWPVYIHWDKISWWDDLVESGVKVGKWSDEPGLTVMDTNGSEFHLEDEGKKKLFCIMAGIEQDISLPELLEALGNGEGNVTVRELHLHLPEREGLENLCFVEIPNEKIRNYYFGETDAVGIKEYQECVRKMDGMVFIDSILQLLTQYSLELYDCMIYENAGLMDNTVMVMTHADIVMEKEAHILSVIKRIWNKNRKSPVPEVFSISPYRARSYQESGMPEDRIWAERFETALEGILSQFRSRFLSRFLSRGIRKAFSELPHMMDSLDSGKKETYMQELQKLQKRFRDPEFRLAIIGNFSSGKSTFLNALFGRELLAISDLPATAIPTYIRWNKKEAMERSQMYDKQDTQEPFIMLTTKDGKEYPLTDMGHKKLKKEKRIRLPRDVGEAIDYLTTTNALIGTIEKVDISFPERDGFDNFCLIDTPGINPGDEESRKHVLQTQNVLRKEADAAMILYTVLNAMARDTKQFMEENAEHLMEDAIIVLTKADLIPENQIEKVMRYTRKVTREQFCQRDPRVYCISAGRAVEYNSKRAVGEKDREWKEGFDRMVGEVMKLLQVRRTEIISRRIASVIEGMVETISQSVFAETERLEKEREILQESSAARLEEELDNMKTAYQNHLKEDSWKWKSKVNTIVHNVVKAKEILLCRNIENAQTPEKLTLWADKQYAEKIEEINLEIGSRIEAEIFRPMYDDTKNYVKEVEECLERYHRYMGKIKNESNENYFNLACLGMTETSHYMRQYHLDNVGKIVAKMALPAGLIFLAVGSMIWNRLRFSAMKEEIKADIQKKLEEYEKKLIEGYQKEINQSVERSLQWTDKMLEEYVMEYWDLFVRIEEEHRLRSAIVEHEIRKNKKDMEKIMELKESLGISREEEKV